MGACHHGVACPDVGWRKPSDVEVRRKYIE